MKKALFISGLIVSIGALMGLVLIVCLDEASDEAATAVEKPAPSSSSIASPSPRVPGKPEKNEPTAEINAQSAETEPEMAAEDDSAEAREERLVEEFDALTDKWMEPSAKGVEMRDVEAFLAQFSKVPADRKQECLQRALNLIPDENAMLLMGVLMDKSQPQELVELVFNDVLNRDESVKTPMLRQVFKDKTHPCWADTAWILDVTGTR